MLEDIVKHSRGLCFNPVTSLFPPLTSEVPGTLQLPENNHSVALSVLHF